jgi:cell filamentation protein, protein adenylyltransferase
MTFDPNMPYDDLPLIPPEKDIETKAVLKQCLTATRALAELKGVGGLVPDQSILINAVPLQEAKMSSEIENIVTTQDELFRAALDEAGVADPQTKEVLRYRKALRFGYEKILKNDLTMNLIREICGILKDRPLVYRRKSERVFIGSKATGLVLYTPPQGGPGLLRKLKNLEAFLLADEGPDPLIRMAVAHYQFEAIHPFTDGNGRSGRILNILYLLQAGLLQIPVLYLSRFIIQNKSEYYNRLRMVTEKGEWEKWLLYMLKGVEETAEWTTGRILAIRDLFDSTVLLCRKKIPKTYSKELIEAIFHQPYCKVAFLVDAGIAKRQTASVYLRELEKIGVLKGEKKGREVIYLNPALIDVLTV